ncbi:FecR family protein [Hymenobacter cellulosilyticus]|uniref:FecR domain-containing protein n=1 Tax=Hymenobacter cellulosilyticus TaxID=2932248 RepID=A0A8T9Q7S8_9BACT|nr:FecR family protein [Hymenobacter cellulosilyticus]UOQ71569.1 FecR domain-containing protein [Hymenobacter cellulosilyticus]
MKPRKFRRHRLPTRLLYSLRSRARRQQQREQWLDALAAAPEDDELLNEELTAERQARMLRHIRTRTQAPARVQPLWPVLKLAAVLVPLLLAAAAFWLRKPGPQLLRYATGVGEQREIVLPDRSRVWLRPRSELTCAATFGKVRTVQLRGEAFFDVTKDPKHPFVVRTSTVAVKVLGTSFLVKAYPQLPAATVLVRTGRVQVAHQNRLLAVLRPQDQLIYNASTHQLTLSQNEAPVDLATRRLLAFEQASLPEIFFLLETYYPVQFELPATAPAVALTGTLDPALSADQITDVLNTLLQRHHLRISKRTATTYQVE